MEEGVDHFVGVFCFEPPCRILRFLCALFASTLGPSDRRRRVERVPCFVLWFPVAEVASDTHTDAHTHGQVLLRSQCAHSPLKMMRCNVCWLQLSHADRVYATQCSHVLCHDCSTRHFGKSQMTCPVCSTVLEPHGLALIDLTPSSDKIKALCGLDPSFILQIASRAIDFYNFQSEMAHAHNAQELENAKHCLQHQTQQHALTQKDLNNQLRTLKYQLEAIVSERDAQVRLVQELQTRLQNQQVSTPSSRGPIPSNMTTSHSSNMPVHQETSSAPTHGVIYRRDEENRNREFDHSSRNAPYRPINWTTLPSESMQTAASNKSYEILPQTSSVGERRTRIFSTETTSPMMPSNRIQMPSPSPSRGVPMMSHHHNGESMVTSSTPKHSSSVLASNNSSSSSSSSAREQLLSIAPSTSLLSTPTSSVASSSRVPTHTSRFAALPNAPERPETPLLHRLAGVSSHR